MPILHSPLPIVSVKEQVYTLLNKDDSGHGYDHIDRVLKLSLKFAQKEKANQDIVALIALLHDVDDYKLFGEENAKKFNHAKKIMRQSHIPHDIQNQVLTSLKSIGYSKFLAGIRPTTIEGQIVSDADMCDALGANGILRMHQYSLKKGKLFFDKNIFPLTNITADKYTHRCSDSSVCHIFEKILKLKNLMMTKSGKKEAQKRHQVIINFLYQLFEEENTPEWSEYLTTYLNN